MSEFEKSQEQCSFNLGEMSFGRLPVKFLEGFCNSILICAFFREKITPHNMLRNNRCPLNG